MRSKYEYLLSYLILQNNMIFRNWYDTAYDKVLNELGIYDVGPIL